MISLILFSDDITYYLASIPVYFLASRSQKIQHKAGFKGTAGKARHVTNLRLACRSIITYDNFVDLSIGLSVCPPLSLSLSLSLSLCFCHFKFQSFFQNSAKFQLSTTLIEKAFESNVRKGENASNQYSLLFPFVSF